MRRQPLCGSRHRLRGYDLLQIGLGIAITLGFVVGGTIFFGKVSRDMTYTDIATSTQLLRGHIWAEASMGSPIEIGQVQDVFPIDLPGFTREADGRYHHRWADQVTIEHHGGYVVEFTMTGLNASECATIAKHGGDHVNGSYRGYLLFGTTFYSDPNSPAARAEAQAACVGDASGRVGWLFAANPVVIGQNTGYAWGDSVNDSEVAVPAI